MFYDFKTNVHPVGILFNIIIADARNHEPESDNEVGMRVSHSSMEK
jgi:hypothetical protein